MEQENQADCLLMRDRINDLTAKLIATQDILRQTKQRLFKLEVRQEKRRTGLKACRTPSDLSPQKSSELDVRLQELQNKIDTIQLFIKESYPQLMDRPTLKKSELHGVSLPDVREEEVKSQRQLLQRKLSQDSCVSSGSEGVLERMERLNLSVREISTSLSLFCDNHNNPNKKRRPGEQESSSRHSLQSSSSCDRSSRGSK